MGRVPRIKVRKHKILDWNCEAEHTELDYGGYVMQAKAELTAWPRRPKESVGTEEPCAHKPNHSTPSLSNSTHRTTLANKTQGSTPTRFLSSINSKFQRKDHPVDNRRQKFLPGADEIFQGSAI